MCTITPTVDLGLIQNQTVELYRPYDIPRRWHTRVGKRQACKVNVDGDLDQAVDAQIVMVTWNGVAADEIGINNQMVAEKVGKNHDLSHDFLQVPVDFIQPGLNSLHTFSTTTHHGIEVQWPGMVLLVKYDAPE